jgi:hypothetical protein
MKNNDKYPEDAVSKSIAALIAANDISADIIKSLDVPIKEHKNRIVWFLIGIGFIFVLIAFLRRKMNKSGPGNK